MVKDLDSIINDLSVYIQNDSDYIEYKRLEDIINDDKALLDRINKFKKMQMEMFYLKGSKHSVIDSECEANKLYTEIFIDETGREFLIYEKKVLDKLNEIYESISSVFDINLSAIKE